MAGLRVLLVDDERDFVSALAERLSLRGFQVATACEGEEALRLVPLERPQVVVLDVRMPGLSGFEVLKRLRTERPELPVLLLTGFGSTQDGVEGLRLGACGYLVKPVDIEAMIEKINQAVGAEG